MNKKHTPGPWLREGRFIYALHEWKGRQVNRFSTQVDSYTSQGGTMEEAEANARLIAAAPDLLEVARKLAAWDKKWPKWSDSNGTSEKELNAICEDAHAAIAKATGEDAP